MAQRKAKAEQRRKAKEAAEVALTHEQKYKRQVKARRKERSKRWRRGPPKGFTSFAKAELMGLTAGIIATPQKQDLCIRLDNQVVVTKFKEVVVNRKLASVRAKLRCHEAAEWVVLGRMYSERIGSTIVE